MEWWKNQFSYRNGLNSLCYILKTHSLKLNYRHTWVYARVLHCAWLHENAVSAYKSLTETAIWTVPIYFQRCVNKYKQ